MDTTEWVCNFTPFLMTTSRIFSDTCFDLSAFKTLKQGSSRQLSLRRFYNPNRCRHEFYIYACLDTSKSSFIPGASWKIKVISFCCSHWVTVMPSNNDGWPCEVIKSCRLQYRNIKNSLQCYFFCCILSIINIILCITSKYSVSSVYSTEGKKRCRMNIWNLHLCVRARMQYFKEMNVQTNQLIGLVWIWVGIKENHKRNNWQCFSFPFFF